MLFFGWPVIIYAFIIEIIRQQEIIMSSRQCEAMVPERPHYIRYHQCSRKAKKGERLCTQHLKKKKK